MRNSQTTKPRQRTRRSEPEQQRRTRKRRMRMRMRMKRSSLGEGLKDLRPMKGERPWNRVMQSQFGYWLE